ncbi:MAG TPA: hypothetical protein VFJ80_10140 [Candidatus Limnocylindrales bacterium]|jgi:hypothetical protein|nr:hypothetical protein [Candidatus Limnocylindrales bacterium]
MDALMILFSGLLAASAITFAWLTYREGRIALPVAARAASLTGLQPSTIRHTPLG